MASGLVVGQSGGVTPVINASLAGVIAQALAETAIGPVYGMRHGVRGLLERDLIRLDGLDEAFLQRLRGTPGAWLGSCRYAPEEAELQPLLDTLAELDVRYYIYIGGNDSADTSARLARLARYRGRGLHVLNVPKTIDNDLPEMDHCPGYATAAAYVALCTRLLLLDTRAMRREEPLRVVEVKGRHSGWLTAAAAAFAEPGSAWPLLIYAPEQPLESERVLREVDTALSRCGHALLVVSEHAEDAAGRPVGEGRNVQRDAFGHDDSHGPGAFLQSLLQTDLKTRCRLEVLGAMQKVALLPQIALDRDEAFACGRHAVELALAGESGACVTLNREPDAPYRITLSSAPLERIARSERPLPAAFLNGSTPAQAFRDWIAPLVAEARPLAERLVETA
ncbi:MAG TPA: diphosphate--fructose-6-phosphate 1-phosphotransferase [Dehalococcoidia bacterium]|nr:diphosphate--fructose-6-phosphate 1-phosphotransferase [Dehalococcoidia bacterium]